MSSIEQALASALTQHQAGQLEQAAQLYRQIIEANPQQPDAWHLLGVAYCQVGQHAYAIEHIQQAIALSPNQAAYYNNLGVAYQGIGQLARAVECFESAARIAPNYLEAWNNLGNTQKELGQLDQAERSYRHALSVSPAHADALCGLGNILRLRGDVEGAIAAYRAAMATRPNWAGVLANLGDALREAGRTGEAFEMLERARVLEPSNALILNNIGLAWTDRGGLDRAAESFHRALELAPGMAEIHNNLGNVLFRQAQYAQAAEAYRRAISCRADFGQALSNLGAACIRLGDLDQAVAALERSIELQPTFAGGYNNLGTALKDQGRIEESLTVLYRGVELDRRSEPTHSSYLYCLNYFENDPHRLLEEHRRWAAWHLEASASRPVSEAGTDPERTLRVGYVSADFRQHPVASFIEPVLAHRDRAQFETVLYSDVPVGDRMTQRLASHATKLHHTFGTSTAELAELVRADRIDILVELAGHTAENRLKALALRPAPIQVSYLGYPATTGLDVVDYRLSDAVADPPGETGHYSERLVRLAGGFCCFQPADESPDVSPSPALATGQVTFGAPHHLAKLRPPMLDLWARLLALVPDSRLLVVRDNLRGMAAERLERELIERGVARDRFQFRHAFDNARTHLELYHDIDVTLDVLPWSGHTTACESMWMGVPVVTLVGNRFAGRMVASVLTSAGLERWIARTADEYLAIAAGLVSDRRALAQTRAMLRDHMRRSPLCDGARFTRTLEDAYRTMWRDYCREFRGA